MIRLCTLGVYIILSSLQVSNAFQSTQQRFRTSTSRNTDTIEEMSKRPIMRRLYSIREDEDNMIHARNNEPQTKFDDGMSSRRQALQLISASVAALTVSPMVASAGKAEIDSKSGELFSPKNEMLGGGGRYLARGIKL